MSDTIDDAAMAASLGVPTTQLRDWIGSGMPRTPAGRFKPEDVRAWLTREAMAGRKSNGSTPLQDAELDRKKATAEKIRVELDVLKDRYVLRSDVDAAFRAQVEMVKKCFDSLPERLEGLDAAAMHRELDDVLTEFAGGLKA